MSDPISYTCTCSCSTNPATTGQILLFYRYYAQAPIFTPEPTQTPQSLASLHRDLTSKHSITGKIRLASEGFNITVGGTTTSINAYISELLTHWSFTGLHLDTDEQKRAFFKPSPGCACAFPGPAKINVKAEITPLGVTDYSPKDWGLVQSLEPWEWHERFSTRKAGAHTTTGREVGATERILVDVRNHYESRIGYFVDPVTGKDAVRPGIRRFSQWPGFASRFFGSNSKPSLSPAQGDGSTSAPFPEEGDARSKEIYTYCTGGIRCEKGVRWFQEHASTASSPNDNNNTGRNSKVYTLHGGILAYLLWLEDEIAAGRLTPSDSLFKGRNYVFDGRGSVGLVNGATGKEESEGEKVAVCHGCGKEEDRLGKCGVEGCHLVLVVCEDCEEREGGVVCCSGCEGKGLCECEKQREFELWGGEQQVKISTGKKKGVGRTKPSIGGTGVQGTDVYSSEIDLNVQTFG